MGALFHAVLILAAVVSGIGTDRGLFDPYYRPPTTRKPPQISPTQVNPPYKSAITARPVQTPQPWPPQPQPAEINRKPSGYHCTPIKVDFSNMGLPSYEQNRLENRYIGSLNLSHNEIKNISPTAFIGLPDLQILDLSSNNILCTEALLLNSTNKLVSLYLSNNNRQNYGLGTINQVITNVTKFPHLSRLYIDGNEIIEFNVDLTDVYPSLTHLNASNNPFNSLSFLTKEPVRLTHLYLDAIGISTIDTHTLKNLEVFSCSQNKFRVLCFGECDEDYAITIFATKSLNKLLLSRNQINDVVSSTVGAVKLTSLKDLDLSHNQLSEIRTSAFSNVEHLSQLILGHNHLTSVPYICGLKHLRTFDLSNNMIDVVPKNCFCNLHLLAKIDMSNNQITSVGPELFDLPAIKDINLSGNKIKSVQWPQFLHYPIHYPDFNSNDLKLNLNNNNITSLKDILIPPRVDTKLYKLGELHFAHNPITHFHVKDFEALSPETVVYMSTDSRPISMGYDVNDDNNI